MSIALLPSNAKIVAVLVPLLLAAYSCAAAQAPNVTVTLKAGTVLVLSNADAFTPKAAKLGDALAFHLVAPVVVGDQLLLPRWLELKGRVTALRPKFEVTLDPLQYGGATIPFAGHPFERKAAASFPPELEVHYRQSKGDHVAGMLYPDNALPILLSPLTLFMNHGKIWPATLSAVTVAADTPMQPAATKPYSGLPFLYVPDGWDKSITCGAEPLPQVLGAGYFFRVDPGSYTFHLPGPPPSAATVEARQDGRYLVFRDKAGLHALDMDTRPDILQYLGPLAQIRFGFDYASLTPAEQAAQAEDRAHGGCGLKSAQPVRKTP